MANEMRLIDADAYESNIRKLFVQYGDGTYPGDREAMIYDEALVDALYALNEAPTVDAVPVVRCKDCKCSKPTAWYSAKLKCCHPSHKNSQVPHEVLPDHFCSYGERRTDV